MELPGSPIIICCPCHGADENGIRPAVETGHTTPLLVTNHIARKRLIGRWTWAMPIEF